MLPKLDIPISEVVISKQLDFRQTLDILYIISPELKSLAASKIVMESIVHNTLYSSYGTEHPSLVVLALNEPTLTTNDLLGALLAAQPILVLHEDTKERLVEVTFHHRALMSQPEIFARSTKYLPTGSQRQKNEVANAINARIYPAEPSGLNFSYQTRVKHPFTPSSH